MLRTVTHRLLPIRAQAVSPAANGTFQKQELPWFSFGLRAEAKGTVRWTRPPEMNGVPFFLLVKA